MNDQKYYDTYIKINTLILEEYRQFINISMHLWLMDFCQRGQKHKMRIEL